MYFWVFMISVTVTMAYFGTVKAVNTFHHDVVPCELKSASYREHPGAGGRINHYVKIECENGQQFTTDKLPAEYQTKEEFAQTLDAHRGDTIDITVGAIRFIDGGYEVYGVSGLQPV